jgi:hypothetical protein
MRDGMQITYRLTQGSEVQLWTFTFRQIEDDTYAVDLVMDEPDHPSPPVNARITGW